MGCLDGLSDNFVSDVCLRPPVAGLEKTVKIVNLEDIDKAAVTFDVDGVIITNFELLATKVAIELPGFKLSNNAAFTIVEKENLPNSFSHNFNGVVTEFDAAARMNLRKLNADTRVVVLVENKFKGAAKAIAFEVYGYNSGLTLGTDTTRSVNENNGVLSLSLVSAPGEEEPHEPYIWFDTDYATTKAAFDAI